jgi:hypothetical protein
VGPFEVRRRATRLEFDPIRSMGEGCLDAQASAHGKRTSSRKFIVDRATGSSPPVTAPANDGKNPAAVALGKLGGAKGGKARVAALSKKERSATAKKAAAARWKKA